MDSTGNYGSLHKVDESKNSIVFRALRKSDQLPVILKCLKDEAHSPEKIDRYRHEFEILNSLSVDGVVRAYGFEQQNNSCRLVLEDCGGESLKARLAKADYWCACGTCRHKSGDKISTFYKMEYYNFV